ncbi:MAG TPA: hypothetical protein VKA43_09165, partial [Gammaproteobacteria bacterium]|nr:hypothetical protein [Gammaproteobacteria bacterium]
MADDFIYFALLVAWLSAPAVIITVPILLWLFGRRGLLGAGQRARALSCVLVGAFAALALCLPL